MNQSDPRPPQVTVLHHLQKNYDGEVTTLGYHFSPQLAVNQVRRNLLEYADTPPGKLKLDWEANSGEQIITYEDIEYYLTPIRLNLDLNQHELNVLMQCINQTDEHPLLSLIITLIAATLQQDIGPANRAAQLRLAAEQLQKAAAITEAQGPEDEP